jgi:hypothetical protein
MKMIKIVAIAALAISSAVSAGELTAEARWANHANQYKGEFSEKFKSEDFGTFVVAGEIEAKQGYKDGKLDALLSGSLGYVVNAPLGFNVQPFVQIGEKLNSSALGSKFIGEGVKVSHSIYGPVSGEVQYRHRGSYTDADLSENRAAASVKYSINKKNAVGFVAYNYWGQSNDHRYGIFYKYSL